MERNKPRKRVNKPLYSSDAKKERSGESNSNNESYSQNRRPRSYNDNRNYNRSDRDNNSDNRNRDNRSYGNSNDRYNRNEGSNYRSNDGYSNRGNSPYNDRSSEGGYNRSNSRYNDRNSEGGYNSGNRDGSERSDGNRSYRGGGRSYDNKRSYDNNRSNNNQQSGYNQRPYKPRKPEYTEEPLADEVRLNKFIAHAGVCSRREADEYIKAGLVKVNGEIVTELGVKVKPGDEVRYNDELLTPESKVYILLNKPKDFTTTVEDPHAERTVLDLVKFAAKERIFPVGRLDKKTTGVLLLTNDGELASRLIHPKYKKRKVYHVSLDKPLTKTDFTNISEGIELDDGPIHADEISYIDTTDKKQIGIEIHSGRNRIIRRIFEHLGYRVLRLDRVYFAGLTKKGVQRGKWRYLSQKEVNFLKMNKFH